MTYLAHNGIADFSLKGYNGNQFVDIVNIGCEEIIRDDEDAKIIPSYMKKYKTKFVIYFYDENPFEKAKILYERESKNKWEQLAYSKKDEWINIAKNILRQKIISNEKNE